MSSAYYGGSIFSKTALIINNVNINNCYSDFDGGSIFIRCASIGKLIHIQKNMVEVYY